MLDEPPAWAMPYIGRAAGCGEDIPSALELAVELGALLPVPGRGDTLTRWTALAAVGRVNLTMARVLEAHADALAILDEAGQPAPPGLSWGVFAAEAPDARLEAKPSAGDDLELTGEKPWCSLGDQLDAALVTAHDGAARRLFQVRLRQPGIAAHPATGWVARGLRTVTSVPISFDRVPAQPVGDPGWYLDRPGFAWGGIGVAACWYGGALGLADALAEKALARGTDLDALAVGEVDAVLHAAGACLSEAARAVDSRDAVGAAGALLALRVRGVVASAAERVLQVVGHTLGPAPLAFDAGHAARMADLGLYLRQHHGERDLAQLGRAVLAQHREQPR